MTAPRKERENEEEGKEMMKTTKITEDKKKLSIFPSWHGKLL